ncbi:hypothetical protein JZ751_003201, partial [Albula glossodonta]
MEAEPEPFRVFWTMLEMVLDAGGKMMSMRYEKMRIWRLPIREPIPHFKGSCVCVSQLPAEPCFSCDYRFASPSEAPRVISAARPHPGREPRRRCGRTFGIQKENLSEMRSCSFPLGPWPHSSLGQCLTLRPQLHTAALQPGEGTISQPVRQMEVNESADANLFISITSERQTPTPPTLPPTLSVSPHPNLLIFSTSQIVIYKMVFRIPGEIHELTTLYSHIRCSSLELGAGNLKIALEHFHTTHMLLWFYTCYTHTSFLLLSVL